MSNSMHQSRKGSSICEDMTSRTSSGFAEDFTFRPDTAPGNSREQSHVISPLVANERSKSVPLSMRMRGGYGHGKLSTREVLQSGKSGDKTPPKVRPNTVQPKVEETLQKDQPWYMAMLREKEERLLQMGDEINRLSLYEVDLKSKDNEIFDLKRQLAQHEAVKTSQETENDTIINDLKQRMQLLSDEVLRLAQFEEECKKKEVLVSELQGKLASVEKDNLETREKSVMLEAVLQESDANSVSDTEKCKTQGGFTVENGYEKKVESLRESLRSATADADALRDKFDQLVPEKLTPEDEVMLMRDELVKKDEIIKNMALEYDEMRKELMMNEGFVNALQRDLQASNNKVMKLVSQVEKAESKMNEAVTEAQAMSKKFSDFRESRKHSDMAAENEHELNLMKAAFAEAQTKIEKMKEKMDKQSKEIRDSHRKVKKGNELDKKQSEEIRNLCRDLEDVRRKEQLSRVSSEQATARYERLRSRIIQAVYVTPGAAIPEHVLTDAVVFNAVKKIIDDRAEFHGKLTESNSDFPPLQIELDTTQEEEKVEDVGATVPSPERKSGKGGRKSPKHR